MPNYGRKSQNYVRETLRKQKRGRSRSKKIGEKAASRNQEVVIELSLARKKSIKIPNKARQK